MKIAIIGTAPTSRAAAPFDDPEWKIWGCSQGNQGQLPRCDAWFELHALTYFHDKAVRSWALPYLGWLKAQTFPVYMQEKNDLIPQAIVFPWRRMIEMFSRRWFTSSVAWMMAYAISQMKEGDTIGLFGVDMAAGEEHYSAQRAGCVRFMEFARERGIEITIPHESCLGQPAPLYGYCETTIMGRRLYAVLDEMIGKQAQMIAQRDKLNAEITFSAGMIENQKYMIRTFLDGEDAPLPVDDPQPTYDPKRSLSSRADALAHETETRPSGLVVPKNLNKNGRAEHAPGEG